MSRAISGAIFLCSLSVIAFGDSNLQMACALAIVTLSVVGLVVRP